jgi:hypothetical protein
MVELVCRLYDHLEMSMWYDILQAAFMGMVIGFGVMLLALCVTVILRAILPPPGIKDTNAHCGACEYQIVNMSTARCPECGADLLKVGLITRRMAVRYRGSTFGLIAGWSLLCLIAGWPLGAFAYYVLDSWGVTQTAASGAPGPLSSFRKTHTFAPPQTWDAENQKYAPSAEYRVRFTMNVTQDSWSTGVAGSIDAAIEIGDVVKARLEHNIDEASFTIFDEDGHVVDTFGYTTAKTGRDLFEAAGFDLTDERVAQDADAFMGLFNAAIAQPAYFEQTYSAQFPAVARGGGGGVQSAPTAFMPESGTMSWAQTTGSVPGALFGMSRAELVAFWIFVSIAIIYIILLVLLLRRRRRMMSLALAT